MIKILQKLWVQAAITFVPFFIMGLFFLFQTEPLVRGTLWGEFCFYSFWLVFGMALFGWGINYYVNFVHKG